ncbi:HD domain-containing protein [bacterium]|nr:HD domain-containing protein [candidate division CSSED10-310 bacterium]
MSRLFRDTVPVPTASHHAQEVHAGNVEKWLDLTMELETNKWLRHHRVKQILEHALDCALTLSSKGDEMTAWVGMTRIASAAERVFDGFQAAYYLSEMAYLSIQLFLHEHMHHYLHRMRQFFRETDHPTASRYWELRGLGLSIQRKWPDAVPSFQLSLEHLENCTQKEIKLRYRKTREELMVSRLSGIVDCFISQGWETDETERPRYVREAQKYLTRLNQYQPFNEPSHLSSLKAAEIALMKNNPESAQIAAERVLKGESLSSRKLAAFRPEAHFILARVSDIEGNGPAMLSHITQALMESLRFPDAVQELRVVDNALALIRGHAIRHGALDPILEAMVIMLEAKDWYTGRDHSKSVVNYTLQLWDGWHPEQTSREILKELYWAGYLHDIGKLRLPRSLLNKIAPLSDEEWRLIRLHPAYSKDILTWFGLDRIAALTGEHHQDAKGTGYPGREPASPMGMCIAIADILEASTSSNRKYKQPKTFAEAIDELVNFSQERYPEDLIRVAASLNADA